MANPKRGPSKEQRAQAMQDLVDQADRAKAKAKAPKIEAVNPPAPDPSDEEKCGREIEAILLKYGMTFQGICREIQILRHSSK